MVFFGQKIGNSLYAGAKRGLTSGGLGMKNAGSTYLKYRSAVPIPPIPGTGMLTADMAGGAAYIGGTAANMLGNAM